MFGGMTSDHVADMLKGQFIAAHAGHIIALLLKTGDERCLVRAAGLDTDENMCGPLVIETVVEFGNAATAECGAEVEETAGALGDGDRYDQFLLLPQLCAFRYVAKAVEVGVGTAFYRDQTLAMQVMPLGILFCPSAPAGSATERVSSKISLIAAQISSVLTVMTSSTY